MGLDLQKGQRERVTDRESPKRYVVGLGWDISDTTGADYDLDVSAFVLNASKKLVSEGHLVFYNNLSTPERAVVHSGDNRTGAGEGDDESITVDFGRLDAHEVLFIVTIHDARANNQNFGQVRNAFIRIYDAESNEEVMRYDLEEDYSTETAVEFGRLYLKDNVWKFHAVGQGYNEDLQFFVNRHT